MSNTPSSPPSQTVRQELPTRSLSRRHFIYTTALAAGSLALTSRAVPRLGYKSPNEKLDVAIIGCGGKGQVDSTNIANAGENIVALCDVDAKALAKAALKWPKATQHRDYRVMIEKEKSADAVTVSIPDHHHAPAAMRAIRAGKHVYCQKPMTHTVSEARALTLAAREHKVATQMGNQGHSDEGIRQLCEMIWSGAIGTVREAHSWTNRPIWPQGLVRPKVTDPVPENLDWDLWLGPAPERPFVSQWPDATMRDRRIYHPFAWRGWWAFGCGALGDMACHVMDGANWALKFGSPASVEVVDSAPVSVDMAPNWSVIRYQFPERNGLPPCTYTWYDGGKKPERPKEMEAENWESSGTIFIGDKGKIMCGEYIGRPRLLPESSMAEYKRPAPSIPRVPGNSPYKDWIRACKGGPPACSNFDVSGPFTEVVVLGNLALRLGKKIDWDGVNMKARGLPEADQFIHAQYRKGWEI